MGKPITGKVTVTRKFEFDSGHRVLGHENKCKKLHGHRYVAEVTMVAPDLDGLGRVIDFGKIKAIIGTWIDTHWDHGLLLNRKDPLVELLSGKEDTQICLFAGNPTAENIAKELAGVAIALLDKEPGNEVEVIRVRVWETPNCCADFHVTPPAEKRQLC